jgi:hypothetical protein
VRIPATWLVAVAVAAARTAPAQQAGRPPIAPEVRVDLLAGHDPAIQFGVGVQVPVGYYGRVGLVAAAGSPLGEGAAADSPRHGVDGRVDLLARFLLDPFRQAAYGLSLGGGASLRAEHGDRARPLLLVALDVEGRRSTKGVVPAVQIGLGGGVRIGVILRRGAVAAR